MPDNNSLLEVLQLYRLNGNKIASFYKQSEVKTKFYYPFKRYKLLSLYLWYISHPPLSWLWLYHVGGAYRVTNSVLYGS